jgi:SPX domain protein involved in polyphosphate accumulation
VINMTGDIFNRREIKYPIREKTGRILMDRLTDYMETDPHNRDQEAYRVTNLYYDTPDSTLIRTSLQKPTYKEKLRLRAYGVPSLDSVVYLEIKKKVDGTVCKRRSSLSLAAAYQFAATGCLPAEEPGQNRQVLREIQYLLTQYDLAPQVCLAYDRRAFLALEQNNLRISFDSNIVCRRQDLRLERGDYGDPLLAPGEWLLEVKANGGMPLWLTHLLAEYRVYPHSFSKYGAEYIRMLSMQKEEGEEKETCSNPSWVPQPALRRQPSQQATF